MVDAPNWGQDWANVMKSTAAQVYAADTTGNTVFSIHMYGVYDTAAEVTGYIDTFLNAKLPIVVGEFGNMHSDGDPDEDTIMSYATSKSVGYLGWSWSGNGGGVEYLDMVSGFNASSLTTWGTRFINGANGIKATSKKASIFTGTNPTTTTTSRATTTTTRATTTTTTSRPVTTTTTTRASTTTTTSRPVTTTTTSRPVTTTTTSGGTGTKSCSATYSVTGQWPGGYQGDVKVTAGSAAISSWRVTWTFANGQTVSQSWGSSLTQSGSTVTATNAAWNGSLGAGASTNFGFIGSWNNSTNAVPAVTCTAG